MGVLLLVRRICLRHEAQTRSALGTHQCVHALAAVKHKMWVTGRKKCTLGVHASAKKTFSRTLNPEKCMTAYVMGALTPSPANTNLMSEQWEGGAVEIQGSPDVCNYYPYVLSPGITEAPQPFGTVPHIGLHHDLEAT